MVESRIEQEMSGETLFCPVCGTSVERGMKHCPTCGAKLSFTICPGCHRPVVAEKFCPFCGTRLMPTSWKGIILMYLITVGSFFLLGVIAIVLLIALVVSFILISPIDPYTAIQMSNDFAFIYLALMNVSELIFLIPLIVYFKTPKKMLRAVGFVKQRILSSIPEEIVYALLGLFVSVILQSTLFYLGVIDVTPSVYSLNIYIMLALSLVVVAFSEEALFRGFFYQALSYRYNWIIAAVISSIIFATVHPIYPTFIIAFLLGIVMCIIYEKSGKNLMSSTLFHYTYNLTIFVFPTILYLLS